MRNNVFIIILIFGVLVSCSDKKAIENTKNQSTEIIARFENGNMKTVKVFQEVDGKQIWVSEIHYHPNGSKSMEGPIQNGLRNGEWISWYEDGKIWSKGSFKNGNRDGMGYIYFPSGKIQIEGSYSDGNRAGLWRSYDERGNLISETDYSAKK